VILARAAWAAIAAWVVMDHIFRKMKMWKLVNTVSLFCSFEGKLRTINDE
jgi:hypothetical protein